jgi:hypothetical protein
VGRIFVPSGPNPPSPGARRLPAQLAAPDDQKPRDRVAVLIARFVDEIADQPQRSKNHQCRVLDIPNRDHAGGWRQGLQTGVLNFYPVARIAIPDGLIS